MIRSTQVAAEPQHITKCIRPQLRFLYKHTPPRSYSQSSTYTGILNYFDQSSGTVKPIYKTHAVAMALATPQTGSPVHQSESHQSPYLLTIPRELRDMIIAPLLKSGHLNILRVCHAITEEALQRLKREATFRINFNIKGRENTVLGPADIPADVRCIKIRFYLPAGGDLAVQQQFRSSSICHLGHCDPRFMDRCTVSIRCLGHESLETIAWRLKITIVPPTSPKSLHLLWDTLSRYTNFNTLIVKVAHGPKDQYWTLDPFQCMSSDASDARVLSRALGPALGPARFLGAEGNRSSAFRPREYTMSKGKGRGV